MFKFFSNLLDRMGSWFGIIFKIILPAVIMYRPIKLTAFTVYIYGSLLGGDPKTFNSFGKVVLYTLYVVFLLMLFFFPRVASIFEFAVIPYYLTNIIILKTVEYFDLFFSGLDKTLAPYVYMIPLVLLFLIAKILFFFFIKVNRDKIEEGRRKKFQML